MKLSDFRLSARIIAGTLITVAVSAVALLFIENARIRDDSISKWRSDLKGALDAEKMRLNQAIVALRHDALFLSNTPPVSGIMRAALNRGYDARAGMSREKWEAQLRQIFSAFSSANPEYYQIRYIGVADGGREIVRVENRGGKVEITPSTKLQQKADRNYFKETLALHEGQLYLSEFDLRQERGVIDLPYLPTLRASVPVFSPAGKIFGMVIINMEAGKLIESATLGLPPGTQSYIANRDGQYLLRPDSQQAFTFELGNKDGLTTEFPFLKTMLDPQAADHLPMQAVATSTGSQYLAAKRVYFDPDDPSRFLLLAYGIPGAVATGQIPTIPVKHIVGGFIFMLLIGWIALLILRRTFAPLKRITAAADRIAAGEQITTLPQAGSSEIGSLTNALNTMLSKLSQREQEVLQINAGLENRVKERTQELEGQITKRKQMEQNLRNSEARFRAFMEQAPLSIQIFMPDGRTKSVNLAWVKMWEATLEDLAQYNVLQDQQLVDRGIMPYIEKAFAGEATEVPAILYDLGANEALHGKRKLWVRSYIYPLKNAAGDIMEVALIHEDITERKKAEEEIHNLAFYDALTKLPNRRLFLDRFRAALPVSARYNNYGAILFIDLDHFKLLNDTLGHDYGDLLLIEVATRIKACVREMDTVARLGGDEFVVLIEGVSDDQDETSYKVGLVTEKIREALTCPYHLNGHEHHSSPSIGVSLYRGNQEPVDVLLQHADMAMYQAKNSGRNAVHFFDPVMQYNVATRTALVNDLRNAIAHQQ